MTHKLHEEIGLEIKEKFTESSGVEVLLDSACCNERRQLPLYSQKGIKLCQADVLIIKNGKVKVIIEIEESDIKPVHIAGKFLICALASFYGHKEKIELDDDVLFVQVVDVSKLKAK